MGGGSSSNLSVTKISKLDEHNLQDTSVHMDNSYGHNDVHGGNVGAGATIYLQNLASNMNLDAAKAQL